MVQSPQSFDCTDAFRVLSFRHMMTKAILLLFSSGLISYTLLNLYALVVSDRILFAPRESSYRHLPNEIRIATGDGEEITAVYLEHPDPRCTLLFSHGNAEDLGTVVPFMQQFHEQGCSVLMYDYRGYGTSEGQPSTAHAKKDARAAYRWLVDEKKIDPETIVSHGRSLGGAVAVWLAAHEAVGGVISEISFASAFRVKSHWKVLPWDKFDSLRLIRRVNCPVLIIHGTDDEVIPLWHGRKVYDAAPDPKRFLWIDQGRHANYAYVDERLYMQTIESFINELVH